MQPLKSEDEKQQEQMQRFLTAINIIAHKDPLRKGFISAAHSAKPVSEYLKVRSKHQDYLLSTRSKILLALQTEMRQN